MKERPILFSAPMVRALLDGSKTQTRRICKTGDRLESVFYGNKRFGAPGDRLWVRESWGAHFMWDTVRPISIPNDGKSCVFYQADGAIVGGCSATQRKRWRPSIHMPRWMSRITLEVVSVRVERLQDITETDAMAEGVEWKDHAGLAKYTARKLYQTLWLLINGLDSWEANPWVWVVEFKRVTA